MKNIVIILFGILACLLIMDGLVLQPLIYQDSNAVYAMGYLNPPPRPRPPYPPPKPVPVPEPSTLLLLGAGLLGLGLAVRWRKR